MPVSPGKKVAIAGARVRASADRDKLILAEIEQSELTRDDPIAETPTRRNAVPYSLRLAPETITQVEEVASRLGVPASALVRGFILDGLATTERQTVASMVDQLAAQVQQLRAAVS